MGEPAVPDITARREAVQVAERILETIRNDEEAQPLTARERWLLAATLVHARDSFLRMSPIYIKALELVRDDGTQDATKWFAFKESVLAVKRELAGDKEA